ncbi:hypothetical protein HYFRA_00007819 [Hymenoscyphus fraxineus]|uniref:Major facilitator superfamily (MFS) profile domain-containing protein n=1 Tax=Hymenoscyphus fraxineus TaxID=746836 RepID=A0A9N9KM70_9HELO|nr:hypothetical protein HYFRA_00007819 [Hymenoscyphus fraxineus]
MAEDDITAADSTRAITGSLNPPEATLSEQQILPLEVLEEEAKVRTKLRTFAILIPLYLVLFIAALDQTIVATSIPTITRDLNSASGYVWIGAAYLLANASVAPIWAKCSDIWGRKPALLAAVIIFAIGSTVAALSTSMRMLIAARALQGTAGGALMSLVVITISDLFSMRTRGLYMGFMGVIWAVAGSAGPLVGGALTQYVSWRWCFWINLPICAVSFVLLLISLDVHNPRTKLVEGIKVVDWFGTFSILAVTLLVLLGLNFGGTTFPWDSPKVICLLVVGVAMIAFFIFSEKRLAKYPLVPLSMFNNWSKNAVFVLAFAHSMVAIGTEFYLPLYFQSVKQASPVRSGILILPMMVTAAAVDVLAGVLMHRTGRYREIIWVGTITMTLGAGLYINFGINTSIAEIVGFEMITSIGIALLFQTPLIAMQNTVSQADTATASATMSVIRNLAQSLSLVLGGVVFQNSMDSQHSSLAAAGLSEPVLEALYGEHAAANVEIVKSIQDHTQRLLVQESFAWSLRNMFIMYTCLSAVAIVASAFVKQKHMSTEHTETKTGIKELTRRES